jgi:hypothetical protein
MSRFSMLLAFVCLACVSCGLLRKDTMTWETDPAKVTDLTALNKKLTQAYLSEDVPTLRGLLSESHVHNNVFGMALDKETFLRDIESGELEFTAYDTPTLRWYVRGEMAVATGIIEAKAIRGGRPVPATRFLFTRIFVKEDGAWKVLLFQNNMVGKAIKP